MSEDYDVHLSAIAAGDPDAFGRWVASCELRVRASLTSFASQVDTEAVIQESLLRIWQVAPKFTPDGRPNSLLRFAIRVARNCAIGEVRRLKVPREHATALLQQSDTAQPAFEPDPRLREIIALCREKLPGRPAQALSHRLRGAADTVLAAELGMTLNTFLQNVTRARKMLAACLERHGVRLETVL